MKKKFMDLQVGERFVDSDSEYIKTNDIDINGMRLNYVRIDNRVLCYMSDEYEVEVITPVYIVWKGIEIIGITADRERANRYKDLSSDLRYTEHRLDRFQ